MKPDLHPETARQLDKLAGRLSRSLLFAGPSGIGKKLAACWLFQQSACEQGGCQSCRHCRTVLAGNHPDLMIVRPDGLSIGIAQVHDVARSLTMVPYDRGQRLVIFDDAHKLTTEAQNALLKVMEEPPTATGIVLVTHRPGDLLPTVTSRAELIAFRVPSRHMLTAEDSRGLDDVLAADSFGRLAQAGRLVEQSEQLVDELSAKLRGQLRAAAHPEQLRQGGEALAALERFCRYREANVNQRAALERLLLEI